MAGIQTRNHCVDERISIISQGLSKNEALQQRLPGLKALLDDYLDPSQSIGTDSDPEGFQRRLLQVFRDSQADFTYEDWLRKLQLSEQKRVVEFVDGGAVGDVSKGFTFGPSLGVREHFEMMAKTEGGPVVVEGLNDKKASVFRKLLCGLTELCGPRKGEFVVSRSSV